MQLLVKKLFCNNKWEVRATREAAVYSFLTGLQSYQVRQPAQWPRCRGRVCRNQRFALVFAVRLILRARSRGIAPQAKSPAFRGAGHGSQGRNHTASAPHPSTASIPLLRRSSSQDIQYCVVLASCIGTLAAKASGLLQCGFCPGSCGPLKKPRSSAEVARDGFCFSQRAML